jgi:hypothetical protein
VLSDVSGMTGQAIIKAILAGERDPWKLAGFRQEMENSQRSSCYQIIYSGMRGVFQELGIAP